MSNKSTVALVAMLALSLLLMSGIGNVNSNVTFADCKTSGKHHGDNNPSEKDFKKQTNICELAKCVDDMKCSNGDKMSKSQYEKIYSSANGDQKKCIKEAKHDGNGKDGVVGYEALDCVSGKGYKD